MEPGTETPLIDRLAPGPEADLALSDLLSAINAGTGTPAVTQLATWGYDRLRDLVSASPSQLLCDCLLAIATHHYAAGQAPRALDPAEDAVNVASALGDRVRLVRALNFCGALGVATLDYAGALGRLSQGLRVAHEVGQADWEALVIAHIGVAHAAAGQYSSAMEAFERVLHLASDNPTLARQRQLALTNIGQIALHTRDIGAGISAIEEAISMHPEPKSTVERIVRVALEQIFVRLLVEVRQFERARERAAQAKLIAAQSRSALAETAALCAEGIAEIASGARDIGLTRLKLALEQARKGAEGPLGDILAASVRGYQIAGQYDVASLHLHELALINQRTRLQQVKLHQSRHMRGLQRDWENRLAAAESAQMHELQEGLATASLEQSTAEYLEKAAIAAELFDDTTGFHVFRVGSMVREIAKAKGLDEHTCLLLEIGARQHDIGKITVPESILNKPGRFTPTERAIMETHAAEGARLIREAGMGLPQMHVAEEIAHHHHERWDGTGYPVRLRGAQIPLSARITAIADVFDALTHQRCYKEAWTITESLAEIRRGRGTHFDPELTDIFLDVLPDLIRRHGDIESYLSAPAANSQFLKDRDAINRELRGDVGVFDVRR